MKGGHVRRLRQKTSKKSSGSLLTHYILEDFQEDFPISLPKSTPDLKNMYIKPRSEKHAYKKTFKWLKNRENEWNIMLIYFCRTQKVHIQVEDKNHLIKNMQQKRQISEKDMRQK